MTLSTLSDIPAEMDAMAPDLAREAVELDTLRWTIINHDEWVQVPAVLTFGPNGMSDRPAGARE